MPQVSNYSWFNSSLKISFMMMSLMICLFFTTNYSNNKKFSLEFFYMSLI